MDSGQSMSASTGGGVKAWKAEALSGATNNPKGKGRIIVGGMGGDMEYRRDPEIGTGLWMALFQCFDDEEELRRKEEWVHVGFE
jgi:hypothetical protein